MSTIVNIYNAVQLKRPPYKGTNCTLTRITHKGIKKPLYHIKVEGHMLYYGCYFPRLVTERGLGVARIISFFNSIYHSKCN